MSEQFDNIIIGSGAGGLATAICLAKKGQSVIVLEQHYVPGGWCHSFTLNGQQFSPGVHYLGQLGEGESSSEIFKGLGLSPELKFFKMKEEGFEHCVIGGKKFDYPSNPEEFEQRLIDLFPLEKKGINKYLSIVWKTRDRLTLLISKRKKLAKTITIMTSSSLLRFGYMQLERVIDRYIKDPDLKAILNIQCGNYGLGPARASFIFHCGVMGHYNRGGYFPVGGGGALVKTMTNLIRKHGGEIRTQTSVKRITLENGAATGVELSDGQLIRSKRVISNADPHITYTELLDKNALSKKLQKKLDKTNYSVSSLIMFVTLAMDVKKAGMDSGNYWITQHNDLNKLMQYNGLDEVMSGEKFSEVFLSCSSLKDPSSQDGINYNFEMITFIDNKIFTDLAADDEGSQSVYKTFKEKVSQKFLNHLEELMPGCREHVVQMELGTPKTNKFYLNATQGNVYGTEKSNAQIGAKSYKAKSEIPNLYLCGASILSHGVVGATYSGVVTAAEILNCEPGDLLNTSSTEEMQIFDSENPSEWPEWLKAKLAVRQRRAKEIHNGSFLSHVDPVHQSTVESTLVERNT